MNALSSCLLAIFLCFYLPDRLGCSPSAAIEGKLVWHNISQPFQRGALCNDFTGAGYFIRKVKGEDISSSSGSGSYDFEDQRGGNRKWIVFLEGGGGCTSPVSCNERFIEQNIRRQYQEFRNGKFVVNVAKAWDRYRNEPLKVTSKLMTSLWRFSPRSPGMATSSSNISKESPGNIWTVEGRDILSTDEEENPDFYHYNHVLVPYCSSDVWLKNTNNFRKVMNKNFTFQFKPNFTEDFQFTFRGVAIFRSVIEDLYSYHGLGGAVEVLLAGSSAGGVGALNHASWLNSVFKKQGSTRLRVLLDSAWFIDFKGEIVNQFAPSELKKLLRTKEILETCTPFNKDFVVVKGQNDEEQNAIMACVSAHLFLARNRFPKDVPLLTIFSRYDLYLLARSVAAVAITEVSCFNYINHSN